MYPLGGGARVASRNYNKNAVPQRIFPTPRFPGKGRGQKAKKGEIPSTAPARL